MEFKIYLIDAFTKEPFKGNQAAVCLLEKELEDSILQKIAAEMNLSETAFILPTSIPNKYDLRWFTPTTEVDLCGHATLASSHVLFNELKHESISIDFSTKSGILSVSKVSHSDSILMSFPSDYSEIIGINSDILDALNISQDDVVQMSLSNNQQYLTIELKNQSKVKEIKPDYVKLIAYTEIKLGGIIITSKADDKNFDFVSRFFTPWFGINEDPVTGSAHTTLTCYWQKILNKDNFKAMQISERTGVVHTGIDKNSERVLIQGEAITILKGKFLLS